MESVRGINIPMYTTLRRTTVAFTMIVEYLSTGQKHSPSVVNWYATLWYCYFLAKIVSMGSSVEYLLTGHVHESRLGIKVQIGSSVILSVCNQAYFVKWMNIIFSCTKKETFFVAVFQLIQASKILHICKIPMSTIVSYL